MRSLLHNSLKELVEDSDRFVDPVQRRRILPEEMLFSAEPLSFGHLPGLKKKARACRLGPALEDTKKANLVFLDPGETLAGKSAKLHLVSRVSP